MDKCFVFDLQIGFAEIAKLQKGPDKNDNCDRIDNESITKQILELFFWN